jgi:hypothetical protein
LQTEIILPPCPHLPEALEQMDASVLTAHGAARDAGFYLTALRYGNYLWQRGLPGRAILKLDRAFGADIQADEEVLQNWPLPYVAMGWILVRAPSFVGNPRVHFQHLADRMNEPRREQRRWRMWACWALCRKGRPELAGDPRHEVEEPSLETIAAKLDLHGHPGETALWQRAYSALGEA